MATGSNDSAIVYSILKFLQGKINSESIADEKKESLEGNGIVLCAVSYELRS